MIVVRVVLSCWPFTITLISRLFGPTVDVGDGRDFHPGIPERTHGYVVPVETRVICQDLIKVIPGLRTSCDHSNDLSISLRRSVSLLAALRNLDNIYPGMLDRLEGKEKKKIEKKNKRTKEK